MKILQTIALDFGRDTVPITVFAKQNDTKSRFVEITPLDRGQSYKLESGITARLHLTKADGRTVINNATISGGIITAELTQQALAAEAVQKANAATANAQTATTAAQSAAQEATTQANAANNAAQSANAAAENASAAAQSANTAASNAQAAATAAQSATQSAAVGANAANEAARNASEAAVSANEAAAAALVAAERAEAAAEEDGIVIIDNNDNTKYLGKFRISGGYPALEITEI